MRKESLRESQMRIFNVPCTFSTCVMMALRNVLFYVFLFNSNQCLIVYHPFFCLCIATHSHKLLMYVSQCFPLSHLGQKYPVSVKFPKLFFPRDISQKSQLSHFKHKCSIRSHDFQNFFVTHMFGPRYSQRSSVELHLFFIYKELPKIHWRIG